MSYERIKEKKDPLSKVNKPRKGLTTTTSEARQ